MELNKKEYGKYVKQITPTHPTWKNVCRAFFVGGLICVLGQAITAALMGWCGMEKETAATWTLLALILLSVVFTGFGWFVKLAAWAGAGVLVPITGFANSVASPAIEYKTEGQVFGIGCKIFTIAGPVILYGVLTSWGLGVIYWIGQAVGIF